MEITTANRGSPPQWRPSPGHKNDGCAPDPALAALLDDLAKDLARHYVQVLAIHRHGQGPKHHE